MSFMASTMLSFSPRQLFGAGEQGVWYDPSDMSTLFQDSDGVTPVTAVEQPVGLILDKSKAFALGSEIATNGDFSNGTTGWSSSGVASISVVNGELVCNMTGTGGGIATTLSGLTVGKLYKVVFTVRKDTYAGSTVQVVQQNGIPGITGFSVTSTNQTYSFTFTADLTSATLAITRGEGQTGTVIYDNVSVKEITGNHATQSTSASRPVLSARYNQLTKSEALDHSDWTKTSMTATDGATDPNGGSTAETLAATGANGTVTQSVTAVATDYIFSVWLKRKTGTGNVDITCHSGGTWVTQSITSSWAKYTVTQTMTAGAKTPGIRIVTSGDEVYAFGADLRVSNDGVGLPAYQRVNTSTDYDTAGFPMYLRFDGTDDSLATGSIDFSGTNAVTIWAGVRKLSDASRGTVVEFGNLATPTNGSWFLNAPLPNVVNGTDYVFASRGTATSSAVFTPAVAPITNVLSLQGIISSDTNIIRNNGAQVASDTADQGTGNYGNYALNIGRRNNASLPFNGRLYGLIARGAASTAGQISDTEGWVNSRTKAYS